MFFRAFIFAHQHQFFEELAEEEAILQIQIPNLEYNS